MCSLVNKSHAQVQQVLHEPLHFTDADEHNMFVRDTKVYTPPWDLGGGKKKSHNT